MKKFKDLQPGDKFYVYNRTTKKDEIFTIKCRNKYGLWNNNDECFCYASRDQNWKVYVQQNIVWSTFPLTEQEIQERIKTQTDII